LAGNRFKHAAVYVHLAAKDLDYAVFTLNGLKKEVDIEENKFKPNTCQDVLVRIH